MKYLLDTNICIFIIKRKPESVRHKLQSISPGDVGVSSVTVSELWYGVAKSRHIDRNHQALNQFLLPLEILSYDENAAARYGVLRAHLETNGTPVGSMDLMIAAHALALNLTMVTNNVRKFNRIPELTVQDWSQ